MVEDFVDRLSSGVTNALTIDVEDYFHVSGFADRIDARQWSSFESRVVVNTHRLLDLFARFGAQGTFFVLGWVAESHPHLVREIDAAGHEIACHSYWHRLVYDLSPAQFRDDLRESRDILQQTCGKPVCAFRAPSFSIVARSQWALEILAEEGFSIDSSIYPIRHDRYGMPGARRMPYEVGVAGGELWEYPPSVLRVAGVNLPVGGGGYLRLLPLGLTEFAFAALNRRARPALVYVHPWEVDPDQPVLHGSRKSRARHYVNLSTTSKKLERLLERFRFGTITASLRQYRAAVVQAPGANGWQPAGAAAD